jgi:N-acetyl-gamma-glutamyl-phosphate reductase
MKRLGLIGARGHTGAQLIRLVARHPQFELCLASSRQHDGERIADHVEEVDNNDLRFRLVDAQALASEDLDALILALPNGLAAPYVEAWRGGGHDGPIIDLSADYRFDQSWYYGLPELTRTGAVGQTHISNPGCYATAMQLALAPLRDLLVGTPVCFGVSGYSGAGTTPSDRNDPIKLRDNLMPYAPFDHLHEKEVTAHLGHRVRFLPHVAEFFRGISLTVTTQLQDGVRQSDIEARMHGTYDDEPLVHVLDAPPWVAANAGRHHACVGGWRRRGDEFVIYATLDNLLKGAATQAVQNLNLACGYAELEGIPFD